MNVSTGWAAPKKKKPNSNQETETDGPLTTVFMTMSTQRSFNGRSLWLLISIRDDLDDVLLKTSPLQRRCWRMIFFFRYKFETHRQLALNFLSVSGYKRPLGLFNTCDEAQSISVATACSRNIVTNRWIWQGLLVYNMDDQPLLNWVPTSQFLHSKLNT